MDSARNAVSSFLGSSGKQTTDVDENVAPAVVDEQIKPHRHEETTEAVDREIHQDHYHTTVQPVQHKEQLPEVHQHNLAPQVEREFQHGNAEQDRARVAADLGQFQDTQQILPTTTSTAAGASVTGEHVHHHVHEIVQPVIHKETIQPEVVHTTIPIHEKHTAPSEHHGLSQLPVKTLDEFKNLGTSLEGGRAGHEEYDGHPRGYNPAMQVERYDVDVHPERHLGTHEHQGNPGSGYSTTDPQQSSSGTFGTGSSSAGTFGSTGVGAGVAGVGSGIGSGHHHEQQADSGLSGRDSALGSGIGGAGGVATGSVAQDLGRDHTQAHQVSDLGRDDTRATVGDSGSTTTGTALGGLGRDPQGLSSGDRLSSSRDRSREPSTGRDTRNLDVGERQGSTRERSREPTNLTGGSAEPPRKDISFDDSVQHASRQGEDPSLDTRGGKLTGTGQDGSHSAVFGLTPDGHKYTDTKNATTTAGAHMPEAEKDRKQGDAQNTSSAGQGSERVADQLNAPDVAQKGHSGKAEYSSSDAKPGAGTF